MEQRHKNPNQRVVERSPQKLMNREAMEPGIYKYDGERLIFISSCDDCELSFKHRFKELVLKLREDKIKHALLSEIERDSWSGAGYD